MEVTFLTHIFPKVSETFILNQIAGLSNREQKLSVIAESPPRNETKPEIFSKYNMKDKVVYSHDPETIFDGLRLLVKTVPILLKSRTITPFHILSELFTGRKSPRRLANLKTVSQRDGADIYHAHFGRVGNSFLGLTKCYDIPYVVSFYGRDASQLLQEKPDRYDSLFQRADAVTVLSQDMRLSITEAGCPPEKTHIQPLCVDTSRFAYRPRKLENEDPVRLLTVARLVEKKGIEYAIEAVAEIAEKYNIEYKIAGDGERRESIESQICEMGLEDTVDLLGWQSQTKVADLMDNSHLFILPSITAESGDKEGTPTVLLEAQSRGLPVISTYHAGIPEIVGDGESGLLVPERDSDALSDALDRLISNSNRWREMGKNGRKRVKRNHSIDVVSERLMDLYTSLQ